MIVLVVATYTTRRVPGGVPSLCIKMDRVRCVLPCRFFFCTVRVVVPTYIVQVFFWNLFLVWFYRAGLFRIVTNVFTATVEPILVRVFPLLFVQLAVIAIKRAVRLASYTIIIDVVSNSTFIFAAINFLLFNLLKYIICRKSSVNAVFLMQRSCCDPNRVCHVNAITCH